MSIARHGTVPEALLLISEIALVTLLQQMSIDSHFPATGQRSAPALEAFCEAAGQFDAVTLSLQGQTWCVQGEEAASAGANRVLWNAQGQGQDTTSAFVQALGQSFSPELSAAVARELGLCPKPGQSLPSRTVEAAMEMATTGRQALAGVDFFTALQFSATASGAEFRKACDGVGIAHECVGAADRQHIDAIMAQHFSHAAAMSAVPVSYDTAAQWLEAVLHSLKADKTSS